MSLRSLLVKKDAPIGQVQINKSRPTKAIDEEQNLSDPICGEEHIGVSEASKKIGKFKRKNYKDAELIYIGYPRKRDSTEKGKKRFTVEVTYKIGGRERKRKVPFGKEGKLEFIDHHNEVKRLATLSNLKNDENFLHPNFYKAYLLNSTHESISDAYMNLINTLSLNV